MQYIKTDIEGAYIIEPLIHRDSRGYFMETFSLRDFEKHVGRHIDFVQDNESRSSYGVVRGLHFKQMPYAQSKLVRCIEGRVLDVAVDLRADSPSFGKWISVELTADNHRQLYLPRGLAHGFAVLSDHATFVYKCDSFYHPESEGGIHPFDPALGIDWQIPQQSALLSDKDLRNPLLADALSSLSFHGNLYDNI